MSKQHQFYHADDVIDLKNEMIAFYSNMFLDGDIEQAKRIIEASNQQTARKIDVSYISLFVGIICTVLYFIIFEIWIYKAPNPDEVPV